MSPRVAAHEFELAGLDGVRVSLSGLLQRGPVLLTFFETDCPTCQLGLPYLNRLARHVGDHASVIAISQDAQPETAEFVERSAIEFTVLLDRALALSHQFDPVAVPTMYLLDIQGVLQQQSTGFDKLELNGVAARLCGMAGVAPILIAEPNDGAPDSKPGCMSRHREPEVDGGTAAALDVYAKRGERASRVQLPDLADPDAYCYEAGFADGLPVVPPTAERVERMLSAVALAPAEVIGRIPPNYGAATVEKIAANAVMAGCVPQMMPVLIALVRAACDERFNLHGIQATTHFAAPLVIVNGPVRARLGFVSGSNVFSNVARANSSLGRAFALLLRHLGGAKPGEIDMSTLGNPGKFSYCIAENEEASPWEPLHVERGMKPGDSALTLYAAEPPRGVSEHNARDGRRILRTISYTLATVWSYRMCMAPEGLVVLCPEHIRTLARDGFSKANVREFLFDNTGVPIRLYGDDGGEGTQARDSYEAIRVDGEPCYRKFRTPESIHIVVAGGDAGKFSAVIGSWGTGPRGSQMVTYPIDQVGDPVL